MPVSGPWPGSAGICTCHLLLRESFWTGRGFWFSQVSSFCWFTLNREQFGGNGRQL